jgi:CheY-like chemotaxis protein
MKTRILLIEDDPGITITLQRLLGGEGHEVVVEKRGDSGLARAKAETFDVRPERLEIARPHRTGSGPRTSKRQATSADHSHDGARHDRNRH